MYNVVASHLLGRESFARKGSPEPARESKRGYNRLGNARKYFNMIPQQHRRPEGPNEDLEARDLVASNFTFRGLLFLRQPSLCTLHLVMAGDSHSHRPSLSQTNKKRKSRHASSRSIRDQQKGRMGPLDPAAGSQKHAKSNASLAASQKKVNRRHHAAQMKQKKIEALEDVTKLFNRKGAEKVQRVIAVVPLTNDVSAEEVVEHLLQSVGVEVQGEGGYRTGE